MRDEIIINKLEAIFKSIINRKVILTTATSKDDIEEWDSSFLLELVVELECEFGVSLDYEQIEKITDVQSIIEFINAK